MSGRLGTVLLALALLSAPARASPLLVNKGEAPPLPAWSVFCGERPDECTTDPSQPDTLVGTPELLELLDAVNRRVNRTVLPVRDIDARGVIDRWEYPPDGRGDCEDIQLLKRKYLVEAGVPRRALLMTVVLDGRGDGHAVLTVRTAREDLILDNLSDEIRRWDQTGYTFIKREAPTPTGWAFVEQAPEPPVMTAAAR
ncbi:MAG TPA: transglutaminase-like cysteine peptidase [Microvirga sp.]|jgi:predicted transglutaminase-like cysteine proteinase|nr:transglutaminase-like cysteine peptidase [Microvirga sp.]